MEQQNSMQPQMNMQGQENGQYVPGYDTQSNMSPYAPSSLSSHMCFSIDFIIAYLQHKKKLFIKFLYSIIS